jgi:hypothetical protein
MRNAISVADFFDATELAIKLQVNELLTHAYVLIEERLKLVVGWAISGDDSPDETADASNIELGCYLERVSRLPSQVRSSCENSIISALISCGYIWPDVLEVEAIRAHIRANHGLVVKLLHRLTKEVGHLKVHGRTERV